MKEATLIYPHQLFVKHPAITASRPIYLIEEPLMLTEFPTHRQKLLLHRLSMRAYHEKLTQAGHLVIYREYMEGVTSESVFATLYADGITSVHIVDVTDEWLNKRILKAGAKFGMEVVWHESPMFLLPKAEAASRYQVSKKHMARFYQGVRRDNDILMTASGEPMGGQWSFDADNQQKLPKTLPLPPDPIPYENGDTKVAEQWLSSLPGEQYGEAVVWLPYTHEEAERWFGQFLTERFSQFGTYEDAMDSRHTRLFHSMLSPLMNIGLLTAVYVVSEAIAYAEKNKVPLNSVEGFIRQIIGWREFIRAAYEVDGGVMRTKNFWGHTRKLSTSYWTGTTGLLPVDTVIMRALQFGYTHHIERLMVMGNMMLLSQYHPDDVYRWFMGMYVDAYDWVMVPNVYGMSQFADGGLFATKPYISGGNYLLKMSNYSKGEWEETWTALYWNFIATHKDFFSKNHRLSMMPKLLEKMDAVKRGAYLKRAKTYLTE